MKTPSSRLGGVTNIDFSNCLKQLTATINQPTHKLNSLQTKVLVGLVTNWLTKISIPCEGQIDWAWLQA
jgi:hypothetical protein